MSIFDYQLVSQLPSRMMRVSLVAATILGPSACIASNTQDYALYPAADPPLRREQVARLSGYVRYVDGREVSPLGKSFTVLPGCHIVGTPSSWARGDASGSVGVTTGENQFALPMKAGYQYEIAVEVNTALRTAHVKAYERDYQGAKTREFSWATHERDVAECNELRKDDRNSYLAK